MIIILILLLFLPLSILSIPLTRFNDNNEAEVVDKILHHVHSTEFGSIWVLQNLENITCISFTAPGTTVLELRQACIHPSSQEIVFGYVKLLLGSLLMFPYPKRVLLIGLGGGVLAAAMQNIRPNTRIDIAEISKDIIEIAEGFFSFKPNRNTIVHNVDGVKFIEKSYTENVTSYDIIIVDAFTPDYIPPMMLTDQFVLMLRGCLSKTGLVVVNTLLEFEESKYALQEQKIYKSFFKNVWNVIEDGNRLLFASNTVPPSMAYIEYQAILFAKDLEAYGISSSYVSETFKKYRLAKR